MSADWSALQESSANGHHRATGENVNICVLDTEVYSNNRGIASKATNGNVYFLSQIPLRG